MDQLSRNVDIPGLKKDLVEMGCTLPEDFSAQLEVHLKVLASRYKSKDDGWNHKTLETVPNFMRPFFKRPKGLWPVGLGEYYITWDAETIRGWKKERLTPRSETESAPIDVMKDLIDFVATGRLGGGPTGRVIEVSTITEIIPRTKARRRGAYAFVKFNLNKKVLEATYSSERAAGKRGVACLPSDKLREYLSVFSPIIKILIWKGRVLLRDENVFLLGRK